MPDPKTHGHVGLVLQEVVPVVVSGQTSDWIDIVVPCLVSLGGSRPPDEPPPKGGGASDLWVLDPKDYVEEKLSRTSFSERCLLSVAKPDVCPSSGLYCLFVSTRFGLSQHSGS